MKAAAQTAVDRPEKGMIFLETAHPILQETLTELMAKDAKKEPVDIKLADFDSTEYHILISPEDKSNVVLSMKMRCTKEVMPMGGKALLDSTFGSALQDKPETGYDVTLKWNVDKLPGDDAARAAIITSAAELRRIVLTAPIARCLEALSKDGAGSLKPMQINYREKETIFVHPLADRVLVFFSIDFFDETDRAIATVFLSEFAEAQRRINNAPAVSFTKEPPGQLKAMPGFKEGPNCVGYAQFTVFKLHVDKPEKVRNAAMLFGQFRAYLHYHIKGAKTYLQTRMRARVEVMLKTLNRANPEAADAEKAVGRRNTAVDTKKTFRRF